MQLKNSGYEGKKWGKLLFAEIEDTGYMYLHIRVVSAYKCIEKGLKNL